MVIYNDYLIMIILIAAVGILDVLSYKVIVICYIVFSTTVIITTTQVNIYEMISLCSHNIKGFMYDIPLVFKIVLGEETFILSINILTMA